MKHIVRTVTKEGIVCCVREYDYCHYYFKEGDFIYREFCIFVYRLTALCFTTTSAPIAATRIRILQMNKHA
jgi:hypothetical protein